MENNQGFIKLSRKYFDNFLWKEPRVYSKAEAWLDLIGSARFEASTEIVNSRVIEVQRGEIPASRRFLEERWKWGSTKVANFIETLTKKGMISQRQEQGQTILILCKYDSYNDVQTSDKPPTKPATNQWQTSDKPEANQRQTKDKEYKKERTKEDINIPLNPPEGNPLIGSEVITHEVFPKEKSSAKKERVVFIAPSVEAVSAYCKENGYTVSAWKFVNYYTSNGWMVGKNKMKDWRAAVRTWQSKENENGKQQLPATYSNNPGGGINNTPRANAADKRAELGNLKHLAGAVLRGTKPQNG